MDLQYVSDGSSSSVVPFARENFAAREAFRPAYDALADALCAVVDFRSAMDVGCGQGFLLDALLAKGIETYGIELSREAREFASAQAAERINIGNVLHARATTLFGLVACVEVAEHIEPRHSEALVERLCSMAGGPIFFTAATPYQPGHGHINCRPTTDWLFIFASRGWTLDLAKTMEIRARLGACEAAPWIAMNAMLFTKEN